MNNDDATTTTTTNECENQRSNIKKYAIEILNLVNITLYLYNIM
jgi:hypothetical protein